jgi:hypothetical protein
MRMMRSAQAVGSNGLIALVRMFLADIRKSLEQRTRRCLPRYVTITNHIRCDISVLHHDTVLPASRLFVYDIITTRLQVDDRPLGQPAS